TSAIPSDSERDSLMAVPNSLIRRLKLSSSSKNSPGLLEVVKPTNALYDSLKSVVKAKGPRGFDCRANRPYHNQAREFQQFGMAVRLNLGRLEELMRRWL